MDDTKREQSFTEFVRSMGQTPKMFYSTREVAGFLGISQNTVLDEINEGRLKYHLPAGRKQGRLIKPEWVDEWIEAGTHV